MKARETRWGVRLLRYSRMLGTVPSLFFGIAYLMSIPAFAFVYSFYREDFYSATAKYEYFRSPAATAVLDDVRSAIVANFEATHGSIEHLSGAWRVNITAFDVEWPVTMSEELRLVVRGSARRVTAPVGWRVFTFPIDLSGMPMGPRSSVARFDTYVNVLSETPVEGLDPAVLFPCPNGEATTCLPIAFGPAASRLERAREALLGFSNPYHYWVPARFVRMLYFSAVTISTLGYGDIVPISTRARVLVTLEVIWGPVLLGLFLNSLITEASQGFPGRATKFGRFRRIAGVRAPPPSASS